MSTDNPEGRAATGLSGGVWLLLACTDPGLQATVGDVDPGTAHVVELALDPGRFEAGAWVSEPGGDTIVEPTVVQIGERAEASLEAGDHVAIVRRRCGPVRVPFSVLPTTAIVSLPYPRCGEAGPRGLMAADDVAAMHGIGLFLDWPVSGPDGVWATFEDARAACAWYGRGLPAGGAADPGGRDGIGVWMADGTVSGGVVPAPVPLEARDHTIGVACRSEPL